MLRLALVLVLLMSGTAHALPSNVLCRVPGVGAIQQPAEGAFRQASVTCKGRLAALAEVKGV
ncbi:hypothetical protein ACFWNN_33755, partial [Lentzea sp. NPDC058450]|uniref:hypothetical protein n=1 Tax=Lentzea sp. NPDC058450 TaxID=3346505 RepID=UPI00366531D4